MPTYSAISTFVADVLFGGLPFPAVVSICIGIALIVVFWIFSPKGRHAMDGSDRIRFAVCAGLLTICGVLILAIIFAHPGQGQEAELAAVRRILAPVPVVALFLVLCGGFTALITRFTRSSD